MSWSENSALIWFIIGLVFILAELGLPAFIVIFFGIGAWTVTLLLELGAIHSFNSQLIVFLLASLLSLIIFRNKGRQIFTGKTTGKLTPDQSIDDFAGQRAKVVTEIRSDTLMGKVEFHGTLWIAKAEVPIDEGVMVEVVARENLTLKVKPL